MLSWPGCVLGDPRAAKLESLLVEPQAMGQRYFDRAQSGTTIQRSLMDDQRLSSEEAIKRLKGVFIGPDGEQTCVIALVSKTSLDRRKEAVDFARRSAALATGLPPKTSISRAQLPIRLPWRSQRSYLTELNLASWGVCLGIC